MSFEQCEQDLVDLIKSAKTKLADKIPIATDKEEKKSLMRQLNKEMADMNSLLADMENEIAKFGPNSRATFLNKLKKYKLDVDIIQKDAVTIGYFFLSIEISFIYEFKILYYSIKRKKSQQSAATATLLILVHK